MVFSKFFAPLFLNKPQSKCTFASNNCPGLLFDIDGIRFGNSLLFISRTSGYYIFLNIHKYFGKNSSFLFLRENWTKSIFIPLFWILSLRKYANFHMKIFIFPTKKNDLFTLTVIISKKKIIFPALKKITTFVSSRATDSFSFAPLPSARRGQRRTWSAPIANTRQLAALPVGSTAGRRHRNTQQAVRRTAGRSTLISTPEQAWRPSCSLAGPSRQRSRWGRSSRRAGHAWVVLFRHW